MYKKALVVILVMCLWVGMGITDYSRVNEQKYPIFCIQSKSKDYHYVGLGYSYDIVVHPLTGKLEYEMYIFGEALYSNMTD